MNGYGVEEQDSVPNNFRNFVIHEHNTRSKYDLHTEFCNTSLFQKSVINMGIRLYKFLPKEIKKLDNFNCFRKKVKSVLLSKSLYTLEEFLNTKAAQ